MHKSARLIEYQTRIGLSEILKRSLRTGKLIALAVAAGSALTAFTASVRAARMFNFMLEDSFVFASMRMYFDLSGNTQEPTLQSDIPRECHPGVQHPIFEQSHLPTNANCVRGPQFDFHMIAIEIHPVQCWIRGLRLPNNTELIAVIDRVPGSRSAYYTSGLSANGSLPHTR